MNDIIYDHYIAIDWAQINMAIDRMTKKSNKITAIDVPSDIKDLKAYLKNLKGTKVLLIEETTTSQWLYVELRDYVDRIIICDPHRNRLLSDGPKNDKIDAYEKEKAGYEKEFKSLARKHPEIRHQTTLPGIGYINAVKIVARVVTPYRFPDKGHYWSYTGLIKDEKNSGQKSYGKRSPRYCRQLKGVYKTGTNAAIGGNNPINDYYKYLIREKGEAPYNARHKACRKLAVMSLGVFKSGRKYKLYKRDNVA